VIYTGLFHEFFHTFVGELDFVIPDFNEPIRFVFDRKDGDNVWNISAHQMFDLFAKMDSRFTAISFDDKKKSLPLQAADMLAYRLHQIRENERNTKGDHVFTALDYALMAGGRSHDEFMAWRNGLLADNAKRRNGRT
jgi:hypothetical protein